MTIGCHQPEATCRLTASSTLMPDAAYRTIAAGPGGVFCAVADNDPDPLITSPDMLLGVRDAARVARVQPKTVHQWVARGHLEPAGLDENGHRLFRALDVAIAEAKLRKHARRPA